MKGGTVNKVDGVWRPFPLRERKSQPYDHPYDYSMHEANALNRLNALHHLKDIEDLEANGWYWDSRGPDSPLQQFRGLSYENKKYVVDELKEAIKFRNFNDFTTETGFAPVGNASINPKTDRGHTRYNDKLKRMLANFLSTDGFNDRYEADLAAEEKERLDEIDRREKEKRDRDVEQKRQQRTRTEDKEREDLIKIIKRFVKGNKNGIYYSHVNKYIQSNPKSKATLFTTRGWEDQDIRQLVDRFPKLFKTPPPSKDYPIIKAPKASVDSTVPSNAPVAQLVSQSDLKSMCTPESLPKCLPEHSLSEIPEIQSKVPVNRSLLDLMIPERQEIPLAIASDLSPNLRLLVQSEISKLSKPSPRQSRKRQPSSPSSPSSARKPSPRQSRKRSRSPSSPSSPSSARKPSPPKSKRSSSSSPKSKRSKP